MTNLSTGLRIADIIGMIDQPYRYVVTEADHVVCPACCKNKRDHLVYEVGFLVVKDCVNHGDPALYCDLCGDLVPRKPAS